MLSFPMVGDIYTHIGNGPPFNQHTWVLVFYILNDIQICSIYFCIRFVNHFGTVLCEIFAINTLVMLIEGSYIMITVLFGYRSISFQSTRTFVHKDQFIWENSKADISKETKQKCPQVICFCRVQVWHVELFVLKTLLDKFPCFWIWKRTNMLSMS